MISLPSDAYDGLTGAADVLGRLGRFKLKQADSSLVGVYASAGLAGENTLIEFFDVKRPLSEGVTGGLVFSFDAPGSSALAATALAAAAIPDVRSELVRRARSESEEKQPWYHLLQPNLGADSPFVLFLSEVTPEYFDFLGARPEPDGRLPRKSYLDAVLGGAPKPEQLLGDIARVTVALKTEHARRLIDVLGHLGYTVHTDPADHAAPAAGTDAVDSTLRGPGVTIRILRAEGVGEGVRELGLSLSRPAPQDGLDLSFGGSRLSADPGSDTASWTFEPVD